MKRIIINLCFLCVLFLMSCNFATSTKKTYEIDVPLIYQETKEWCLPACTLMCTEFFADSAEHGFYLALGKALPPGDGADGV